MEHEQWEPDYTERAQKFWADYQATHDMSHVMGQAVGIDPVTGKVWFGDSSLAIHLQQKSVGDRNPLLFSRVGKDYCGRMGGRR